MTWRVTEVALEIMRGLMVSRSKLRSVAYAGVALGSLSGLMSASDWSLLSRQLERGRVEGATTMEVISSDDSSRIPQIDPTSCTAIADREPVIEALALSSASQVRVVQLGGRRVPLVEVAASNIASFSAAARAGDSDLPEILVGSDLAGELGVGMLLAIDGSSAVYKVAGYVPRSLDYLQLGGSLVSLVPERLLGGVERCLVRVRNGASVTVASIVGQIKFDGSQLTGRWVSSNSTTPLLSEFKRRSTRFIPIALGLILAVGYGLTARSRVSEYGLIVILSGRGPVAAVWVCWEAMLIAFVYMISQISSLMLAQHLLEIPVLGSAGWALAGAVAANAGCIVAGWLYAFRSPLQLLKD